MPRWWIMLMNYLKARRNVIHNHMDIFPLKIYICLLYLFTQNMNSWMCKYIIQEGILRYYYKLKYVNTRFKLNFINNIIIVLIVNSLF